MNLSSSDKTENTGYSNGIANGNTAFFTCVEIFRDAFVLGMGTCPIFSMLNRPEEIMLFRFFKVFPNADAFEFCFYILKAGLLY